MSICAPKPFGSKFLKGGYSYWPLWWYGQRNKLHNMSGQGEDLTPDGVYFDGQGYYFDGDGGSLRDESGHEFIMYRTVGSWHSIYLTEDEVPEEGSIQGTGKKFFFNYTWTSSIVIKGKIVLNPKYCPNMTNFVGSRHQISSIKISAKSTSLTDLWIYSNEISTIDLGSLPSLETLAFEYNNVSTLDVSAAPVLWYVRGHHNSMNQDVVDTVLCTLDSNGVTDGYLDISNNAAPSATGIICRDSLISKGWDVTTD